MRLDQLQKGFWGYRKESVFRYIVSLEKEASRKLMELEERMGQEREELIREKERLLSQLQEKEEAVRQLQEEIHSLRQNQADVIAALVDAQVYFRQLREEAKTQARRYREEFRVLIEELDGNLDKLDREADQLAREQQFPESEAPEGISHEEMEEREPEEREWEERKPVECEPEERSENNMSLFRRLKKAEE